MRIVRNISYVKRRKKLARWASLVGVVLLVTTMIVTIQVPTLIGFGYLLLFVGMITFHFGMQQLGKWSRTPRNDQLIDTQLRSLGEKYALLHYTVLGKRTVDHLLIHPGGILTLTARELPGKVQLRRNRWRKAGGGLGRLFGMGGPQLGNPTLDAEADLAALRTELAARQLEVEVDAAIVFLHPMVVLDVEEPEFPVTNAEGLPRLVRSLPEDLTLQVKERQALIEALAVGEEVEQPRPTAPRRRPVKRRAA